MSKDAVATMGDILPDDAGGRDAVHVAVFSATANGRLHPGQGVVLIEHGEDRDAKVAPSFDAIGIVDPFLDAVVEPGERFWVYLNPRTITALSHRWSHPSFEGAGTTYVAPSQKLASEEWLREWTARADCPGYEAVMDAASRIADGETVGRDDEYMHFDGRDASGEIPPDFWHHAEIVLGQPIMGRKASYFSCSC